MCLNLPSFEVKIFCYIFLLKKMENKMNKALSPVFSLKLKNIILFLNRGIIFIFFKWSYSQRSFNVAQRCENLRWK